MTRYCKFTDKDITECKCRCCTGYRRAQREAAARDGYDAGKHGVPEESHLHPNHRDVYLAAYREGAGWRANMPHLRDLPATTD